jgi:hypothetical protein
VKRRMVIERAAKRVILRRVWERWLGAWKGILMIYRGLCVMLFVREGFGGLLR